MNARREVVLTMRWLIVTHVVQAFWFRMWWLLPTVVLAGLGELIGWSGRYWSSFNGGVADKPYTMQYGTGYLL